MKKYRAAIIGLGQIGQGFDYDRLDDAVVATHASGYTYHPGYELVGAVDPDGAQRKRFEEKFRRPSFVDMSSLMAESNPEVFSIATPAAQHLSVFVDIMRYRPAAVLCEKPIAASVADGRKMQAMAEECGCALAVNYMRRYEPGSVEVRRTIAERELGEVFKGAVWYSKGLVNNGSHFVDLLRYWLGDVDEVKITDQGRKWNGTDPEPDLCLKFNGVPIYLLAGREELFSIGKMELMCERGSIVYADSGNLIEVRRTYPSPLFKGYMLLSPETKVVPTDLRRYQLHVLEALYRHLTCGETLNSDGTSATQTLEVIECVCGQLNEGVL
ncbi:MAG: Gfo/Idh/MocA family oxidoreductase [Syntrophorhabdus sp.]|nr:Gfo/Idh/MocA family oxidoreductase [Syntrophorhabdus sp.]